MIIGITTYKQGFANITDWLDTFLSSESILILGF